MKKRFLVYQQVVTSKKSCGNDVNIDINVNIRNVGAKSKEEALGKFILEMSKEKYNQVLDPVVFELSDLKKID